MTKYAPAYAYATSTNAGKMKRAKTGAWYVEEIRGLVPPRIAYGPCESPDDAKRLADAMNNREESLAR
jgi:hypothetical protein